MDLSALRIAMLGPIAWRTPRVTTAYAAVLNRR